jgi:4-nitrophenyl phosphatase
MKQLNKFNLKDIHALVIDMDGVLWRGNDALPGLVEFFNFLNNHAIAFILATNNAGKTPAQVAQKLTGFGVTVKPEHILTSSLAAAAYLQRELPAGASVYLVGQEGLRLPMQEAGFTILSDASQPAAAVVAGIDFTFTYDKLKHATLLIRRGARFIGTNADLTLPVEDDVLYPGAGSILAAIQAATGVAPLIMGKPERFMFDLSTQKMGVSPQQTATLGDRLETDILGGQRAGLKTILVTSGVDNEDSIVTKGIQPDVIFSGIDELTRYWAAVIA